MAKYEYLPVGHLEVEQRITGKGWDESIKQISSNHQLQDILFTQKSVALNSAGTANQQTMGIYTDAERELAFISQGIRGFAIVDISDPDNIAQIGSWINRTPAPTWHPVRQVAIINNHLAFVTRSAGEGTIELLDISDIENPVVLDYQVYAADFSDIFTDGAYFYVPGQQEGMFKFSNTVPMRLLSINATPDVETQGGDYGVINGVGYVFFANYVNGVRIVDSETMGQRVDTQIADEIIDFVGLAVRPFKCKFATIRDRHYLFCCGNTGGDLIDPLALLTLDVTDVENPFWLPAAEAVGATYLWTTGDAGDKPSLCIDIYNNEYAVIGSGQAGASFFDIRVPEKTRFINTIDNMDTYTGSGGTEKDNCAQVVIYEKDGNLYLISGDGTHTPNTDGSDQVYMDQIFL